PSRAGELGRNCGRKSGTERPGREGFSQPAGTCHNAPRKAGDDRHDSYQTKQPPRLVHPHNYSSNQSSTHDIKATTSAGKSMAKPTMTSKTAIARTTCIPPPRISEIVPPEMSKRLARRATEAYTIPLTRCV